MEGRGGPRVISSNNPSSPREISYNQSRDFGSGTMSSQPSSYDDISVADSDGESIRTCISLHLSPQRKPSPLPIDDRVLHLGGQTFATNLRASYLKSCKNSRPPHSGEIRLLELVRENAAYRHEIQFFRAAYQAAGGLVRAVNGIDQEMILQYYLEPTRPGCRDEAWLDCGDLHANDLLGRCLSCVILAPSKLSSSNFASSNSASNNLNLSNLPIPAKFWVEFNF